MEELKKQLDSLLCDRAMVTIAIDGPCTAGKTTLAAALAEQYACNVFHMDDFFLRPEQRTAQRLAEPGGNVDYERFRTEILEPLNAGGVFFYRPFDCRTASLAQPVNVSPKKLNIIEGSYSHHPYFDDPYDWKIFLTISPDMQRQRILQRPQHLHQRFFDEWIPRENAYFAQFQIMEKSDFVH